MRFATVYAAFAAALFSTAMAAPTPVSAAIVPDAPIVERQLLGVLGSNPSDGTNGNGNGNGNKKNGNGNGNGVRIPMCEGSLGMQLPLRACPRLFAFRCVLCGMR